MCIRTGQVVFVFKLTRGRAREEQLSKASQFNIKSRQSCDRSVTSPVSGKLAIAWHVA